jgi:hypothetical protein
MSAEKLADIVARTTSRRSFIERTGVATFALVAGALGLNPAVAKASPHGCSLCTENVNPSCGPYCAWCWHVCDAGQYWVCCEGYTYTFGDCRNGHCSNGWICSWYYQEGNPC